MKNVLYMTGAVVNAGDFLIEKRAKALLKKFIPNIELTTEVRVKTYSDRIDYLNSFDAILFPGGPLYQLGIYPNAIPFVRDLSLIKRPVFFIGGGLKSNVYGPIMSEQTREFFSLGTKTGVPLGCRDILTYRFLKQQGFKDSEVLMTGCPAWYSLDHVDRTAINVHTNGKRKICVSEPAMALNIPLLVKLLYALRNKYKNDEVLLVIHRENKNTLEELLPQLKKELGIKVVYISGSAEGFEIYDDCDIHIGFRVHAHIYNLSIRNISFLINEDIRGRGVNLTLGLENIEIEKPIIRERSFFYDKFKIAQCFSESLSFDYIISHLLDCIEESENQGYNRYREAYKKMKVFFDVMQSHITHIGNVIS